MNGIKLIKFELEKENPEILNSNFIAYKKKFNKILSEAHKVSKLEKCIYCGKKTSSFCNSHSIPRFCLNNIAKNGEVLSYNKLVNFPLRDFEKGINRAGTFQLICRECDNEIFQEYEEPNNYKNEVTQKMIAQIAMKNYLNAISKTINELAIFNIIKDKTSRYSEFDDYMKHIKDIDLNEYKQGFQKAKRLSKKNWSGEYNVFYYEKLNYVVPIAFQNIIALTLDLDGQVVNDIYYDNPKYKLQHLHICIFPLKHTSIVMMFVDSSYKRYRNFYKKFNTLHQQEKLAIINYIIFLYSEDIFLSKEISTDILQNKALINVCKQSSMIISNKPFTNVIEKAQNVYDLSKYSNIPNLLSEKYRLR